MAVLAINGSDHDSMSSLKPIVATIHPVNVVPRLEPMIMHNPLRNEIMPAPVNASTISPTSELLWMSAVTTVPTSMAATGFLVYRCRNSLNGLPATACITCSIRLRPNRNKPRPARNLQVSMVLKLKRIGVLYYTGVHRCQRLTIRLHCRYGSNALAGLHQPSFAYRYLLKLFTVYMANLSPG